MILKYIVLHKMAISKPYIKIKWTLRPGSVRKDKNIHSEYNYINNNNNITLNNNRNITNNNSNNNNYYYYKKM